MPKILIVDDEAGMRQVISKVLSPKGYAIVQAEDGAQALATAQAERPDLVILDIRLPDMDGLEILAGLRKQNPELPVIMLSGFGDVETAVELVRQGAYDYLSKPFKVDKLLGLVSKALNEKEVQASDDFIQPVKNAPPAQSAPVITQNAPQSFNEEPPLEDEKKPGKKMLRFYISLGVVFAAGLGYFLINIFTAAPPEAEYSVNYSNPSAIYWDGKYLWVSDWMQETVYKHAIDDNLSVEATYKLPGMHVTGITGDGNNLYTCNSFEKKIYKHDLDAKLSVVATYDAPGPGISGLCFDGKSLWSLDFQQGKIYKHSLDNTLTVVKTYDSPAANPCGMYKKDKIIYIADAGSNRIFRINPKGFAVAQIFTIPGFGEQNRHIAGFTSDGRSIYICSDGLGKIIRVPISGLKENQ